MALDIASIGSILFNFMSTVSTAWCEFWQVVDGYTRPAYLAIKRKAIHFLKATGILITIAFAGASLYYAKAAADDARCQLELQKRQYCETASESMKQKHPCDYILAQDIPLPVSCCCGGPHTRYQELIFTLRPWPYFQTYVRRYCNQGLIEGKPWWHQWGRPYTTVYFRPILWRFPDAYWIAEFLNGSLGVTAAIVGSVAVLRAYSRNRQGKLLVVGFYLMVVVIPMLFSSLLLSAELGRQNHYWKKDLEWDIAEFNRMFRNEPPQPLPRENVFASLLGKVLTCGLNGLQSRSLLGVFDSETNVPYLWWHVRLSELDSKVVVKEAHGKWAWWADCLEMAYTIFAVVFSFVYLGPRVRRADYPRPSPK